MVQQLETELIIYLERGIDEKNNRNNFFCNFRKHFDLPGDDYVEHDFL